MYKYRCKKRINGKNCDTIVNLKKKVEDYVIKPKCPNCGSLITYMDKHRMNRKKTETCFCDGVPYPHRIGSVVFCRHSKRLPTDEDHEKRYSGYIQKNRLLY